MDEAFNKHSPRNRGLNRSSANLNHLTLAPISSRLPITDLDLAVTDDNTFDWHTTRSTSYLHGRSAPVTPSILGRAPNLRSDSRAGSHSRVGTPTRSSHLHSIGTALAKSKSAVQLDSRARPLEPMQKSRRLSGRMGEAAPNHQTQTSDRSDGEWLLRAGALISGEAREAKGQGWLSSRASSTSLAGSQFDERESDDEETANHRAWREQALADRKVSRRGSVAFSISNEIYSTRSTPGEGRSRRVSRANSRTNLSSALQEGLTAGEGYFPQLDGEVEARLESDLVGNENGLETLDMSEAVSSYPEDEAHVRRLVKDQKSGAGWFGSLLNWSLASVDEDDEDNSSEVDGCNTMNAMSMTDRGRDGSGERQTRARTSALIFDTAESMPIDPPDADEGGWRDAAWLLSLAAKIIY